MQEGRSLAGIDAASPSSDEYFEALVSTMQEWQGKAANRALDAIKLQMEHAGEIAPSTLAAIMHEGGEAVAF